MTLIGVTHSPPIPSLHPSRPGRQLPLQPPKELRHRSLWSGGAGWSSLEPTGAHWNTLELTGVRWSSLEYAEAHWSSLELTGVRWNLLEPTARRPNYSPRSSAYRVHIVFILFGRLFHDAHGLRSSKYVSENRNTAN